MDDNDRASDFGGGKTNDHFNVQDLQSGAS